MGVPGGSAVEPHRYRDAADPDSRRRRAHRAEPGPGAPDRALVGFRLALAHFSALAAAGSGGAGSALNALVNAILPRAVIGCGHPANRALGEWPACSSLSTYG